MDLWIGYITTSINDGPGCLALRCPDPSCSAVVDQDMINSLVSDEDRKKYARYLLRSYVEDNKKVELDLLAYYLLLFWVHFNHTIWLFKLCFLVF